MAGTELEKELLMYLIGFVVYSLLTTFLIFLSRKTFWLNLLVWWRRPKQYGLINIIHDDQGIETKNVDFKQKEIKIKRKGDKGEADRYERYVIDKKLVIYRGFDRVPNLYYFANNPFPLNLSGNEKNLPFTYTDKDGVEHLTSVNVPDASNTPSESADVVDNLILRHKNLNAQDLFQKYWKILLIVTAVGALLVLADIVIGSQNSNLVLEECVAKMNMVKDVCMQKSIATV